jgi:hypothetical protein
MALREDIAELRTTLDEGAGGLKHRKKPKREVNDHDFDESVVVFLEKVRAHLSEAETGGPAPHEHRFEPVKGMSGCARCNYARGEHPSAAQLGKAKKPLKGKALDREINRLFKLHGSNIEFDIFDLGKISNAGKKAADTGGDIEQAVKDAIAQYRKN